MLIEHVHARVVAGRLHPHLVLEGGNTQRGLNGRLPRCTTVMLVILESQQKVAHFRMKSEIIVVFSLLQTDNAEVKYVGACISGLFVNTNWH